VEIFRLVDGRIAEWWHVDDNPRLQLQPGAGPPPAAPPA
jgi:hypothetical protein